MSEITRNYFEMKKEELMNKKNVLIAIGEIDSFVNFMAPVTVHGGALTADARGQYLYIE